MGAKKWTLVIVWRKNPDFPRKGHLSWAKGGCVSYRQWGYERAGEVFQAGGVLGCTCRESEMKCARPLRVWRASSQVAAVPSCMISIWQFWNSSGVAVILSSVRRGSRDMAGASQTQHICKRWLRPRIWGFSDQQRGKEVLLFFFSCRVKSFHLSSLMSLFNKPLSTQRFSIHLKALNWWFCGNHKLTLVV